MLKLSASLSCDYRIFSSSPLYYVVSVCVTASRAPGSKVAFVFLKRSTSTVLMGSSNRFHYYICDIFSILMNVKLRLGVIAATGEAQGDSPSEIFQDKNLTSDVDFEKLLHQHCHSLSSVKQKS